MRAAGEGRGKDEQGRARTNAAGEGPTRVDGSREARGAHEAGREGDGGKTKDGGREVA